MNTLQLHYNAVLYNAVSQINFSNESTRIQMKPGYLEFGRQQSKHPLNFITWVKDFFKLYFLKYNLFI